MKGHISVEVILWMIGALLSFSLMAIGARELAGEISTIQILFFRSLIGLPVISLIIWRSGQFQHFLSKRVSLHTTRNIFHFIGQYGWIMGLGLLPLAEVFALEFTVPFWTLIIAGIVLNETITRRKLMAVLLGMAGVLIIVEPGSALFDWNVLVVLAAAVFFSLAHVSTKVLVRTDSALTVLFYMCLIQLPIGLLLSLGNWTVPDAGQYRWLFLLGLSALSAHYCLSSALSLADAAIVVTLDFMRLPFIALVGVVFYHETLSLSLAVGSALMLGGNLLNVIHKKA